MVPEMLLCLFVVSCFQDFDSVSFGPHRKCRKYLRSDTSVVESIHCENESHFWLPSSVSFQTLAVEEIERTGIREVLELADKHGVENLIFNQIREGHFDWTIYLRHSFVPRNENLTSLTVTNSRSVDSWNLDFLRGATLVNIHYENCSVADNELSAKFGKLLSNKLRSLTFKTCELQFIDDTILQECSSMRTLILSQNNLSRVTFFKHEMKSLWMLDLSHNKINYIPEEITRMLPAIRHLNLADNQIRTVRWLSKSLWNNLHEFWLMDNDIQCCNLLWTLAAESFPWPHMFELTKCNKKLEKIHI